MGIVDLILGPKKKKAKKDLPDVSRAVLEEPKSKLQAPDSLPELHIREVSYSRQEEIQAPIQEQVIHEQSYSSPKQISESDSSFFNGLVTHLKKEDMLLSEKKMTVEEWRSRNIVKEMKQYWDTQKTGLEHLRHTQQIESDMQSNVDELQRLEAEWQRLEAEHEQIKKTMDDKEIQIAKEGEKLKQLLKKWNLKKDVAPQYYFHVNNGTFLKNAHDLHKALITIKDETYNSHVTDSRNDFANWIKDVFNDQELAIELAQAQTKDKSIALLEQRLN